MAFVNVHSELSSRKFNELWRDVVDEPDAVGGAAEDEAGPVHISCTDGEDHRLAVPAADAGSGFSVWRKMNIMAVHALQAVFADRIEKARRGTVIEKLGRRLRRILQIHRDGMPLARADAPAIFAQGKALFVAGC